MFIGFPSFDPQTNRFFGQNIKHKPTSHRLAQDLESIRSECELSLTNYFSNPDLDNKSCWVCQNLFDKNIQPVNFAWRLNNPTAILSVKFLSVGWVNNTTRNTLPKILSLRSMQGRGFSSCSSGQHVALTTSTTSTAITWALCLLEFPTLIQNKTKQIAYKKSNEPKQQDHDLTCFPSESTA